MSTRYETSGVGEMSNGSRIKTTNNICPICGDVANTITGHHCPHLLKVQGNGLRVWVLAAKNDEPRSIYKILADRM